MRAWAKLFSLFFVQVTDTLATKHGELPRTATAMCSSGFETQNLKYRTNDDSRTNVE